jgi:hypothetical protein
LIGTPTWPLASSSYDASAANHHPIHKKSVLTTAVWKTSEEDDNHRLYDGSAAKPAVKSPAAPALRHERGNLATKYDASPENRLKSLRRQFGIFYDTN